MPLRLPTKKVSADRSSPGAELSTWRSRKQGFSFSRNTACSGVIAISLSALAFSNASQRSVRVPRSAAFRIFWMVMAETAIPSRRKSASSRLQP